MRLLKTKETGLEETIEILRRPYVEDEKLGSSAAARIRDIFGRDLTAGEVVRVIVEDIRKRGDEALFEFSVKIDGAQLDPASIRVTKTEIEEAYALVGEDFLKALRLAKENIIDFHRRQLRESWFSVDENGAMLGQRYTPIERVGLYVPGGTAAYPSSVLMNAVPAKVAGVEMIVMTTPPSRDGRVNPYIIAAAHEVGIDQIFKAGGAQAVAALAFGTESIPKVDKIVGPGNIFVTLAKKMLYGYVGIDMLAGPSEIFIIADDSADPAFLAADMLSQSEHDPNAAAILATPSESVAFAVMNETMRALEKTARRQIAAESLERCGAVVKTESMEEAVAIANAIAPEHLELEVENPHELLGKVKHAGAIFLGRWTPESVGDYTAGSNHVLPTNGTARFSSALGVDDFIKRTNIISYSKDALMKVADATIQLADKEGLDAHAEAVRIRVGK